MTIYKTSSGVTLEILRIHRSLIDAYARDNPAPEPPTIEVRVFGGVTEKVADLSNPDYLVAMTFYRLKMAQLEFDLVVRAVNIVEPDWELDSRITDLTSLGFRMTTKHSYLRYVALAENDDLARVMGEVLYLSTVSDRGILEAQRAFGIQWQRIDLEKHRSPPGKLRASPLYQSRVAASSLGYTWEQFCELSGPEQSTLFTQYQCGLKIEYLVSEEGKV